MGIPRFKIKNEAIQSGVAVLSREESHHALSVLRLKRGDAVELLDGHGQRLRGVAADTRGGLLFVAVDQNQAASSTLPSVLTTLAAAVIKPDKMDWLVQKASELGVTRIAPLVCERGVVRLNAERWSGKVTRWRKIADESCKQCGRAEAPRIDEPRRFSDFLEKEAGAHELVVFPTLSVKGKDLRETFEGSRARNILLFIGPEGDFSPDETKQALAKGALPVTLGSFILRSETAAVFALSCAQYYFGRHGEK